MIDTISETEACGILSRLFQSRGYAIKRNLTFREYGVEFHIDGWDAKARVGFEFLTSEDDDHDDLSLEEYKTLSAAQQRGELSLFILDEVEPLSAADLAEMANEFLDEVAAAKSPRRRSGKAKAAKKAAPKKTAGKAAVRKAAKKPTGKKVAVKKAAQKAAVQKVAKKPAKTAAKKVAKKAVQKKRPRRK